MSKSTPVVVLLGAQLLVIALALAFQLRVRADLLAGELPALARERLHFAGAVIPWTTSAGVAVTLVGLFTRRGRPRLRFVSAGLVLSAVPAVVVTLAVLRAALGG